MNSFFCFLFFFSLQRKHQKAIETLTQNWFRSSPVKKTCFWRRHRTILRKSVKALRPFCTVNHIYHLYKHSVFNKRNRCILCKTAHANIVHIVIRYDEHIIYYLDIFSKQIYLMCVYTSLGLRKHFYKGASRTHAQHARMHTLHTLGSASNRKRWS